jgi:hypothetical protein
MNEIKEILIQDLSDPIKSQDLKNIIFTEDQRLLVLHFISPHALQGSLPEKKVFLSYQRLQDY